MEKGEGGQGAPVGQEEQGLTMMALAPTISPGVLGMPYPAQKLGLPDSIAAAITEPLPCDLACTTYYRELYGEETDNALAL